MNRSIILITLLTSLSYLSYAADCSNLDTTPELTTVCSAGSNTACSLDKAYKISSSIGSQSSLLPPIEITSTGALCITNDTLTAAIEIYAQSFYVNGGLFQIGSALNPITSDKKVTLYMGGNQSVSPAPQPLCASNQSECSAIAKKSITTYNNRDITVTSGGKLLMYGLKGLTPTKGGSYIHSVDYDKKTADGLPINKANPGKSGDINQLAYFNNLTGSNSWTYLAMPAGPSYFTGAALNVQAPIVDIATIQSSAPTVPTLTVDDIPYLVVLSKQVAHANPQGSDWQSGDWISIATTSFVSHQTEIVQICKIYDMTLPQNTLPAEITSSYADAIGDNTVSLIILAGSPSVKSQCPTISGANTPLKSYHFGSLMPTPGFFSNDQSYTNSKGQIFSAKKGQAYSFYDAYDRNFGIDERAEVALLSRNIKLTSLAGQSSGTPVTNIDDQYFGGNIAVMNHNHGGGTTPNEQLILVGVEIEKFGQPLVGRYPIHLHRLNSETTQMDPNALLVQDSSVHHSFNKCYVTHDTMGAKFYNNSCIRTIGQGFYLEDGHNIAANQYIRNHVAGVMAAALNYDPTQQNVTDQANNVVGLNLFWNGDNLGAQSDFYYNPAKIPDTSNSGANTGNYMDSFGPSGFWITTFGGYVAKSLPNLFVNNSVAGCQLRGAAYWLVRQDVNSITGVPSTVQEDLYPVFTGNRGHACYDGIMAGTNFAIVQAGTGVKPPAAPPKPVAPYQDSTVLGNAPVAVFDSPTLTQIQQKAFWYRGVFVAITNGRFAALKQGMTLLGGGGPEGNLLGFWGLVTNSVFAAVTNNNVSRYVDCNNNFQDYGTGKKTFSPDEILTVHKQNELAQCVPVNPNNVSLSPAGAIANNSAIFGDIYPNFNFQGYTFYDGPARMEYNRFINFRADATNPTPLERISGESNRYLVTTVDAHKMLDTNTVAQLANDYLPGGNDYSGYNGDAAFSWLKGNQQSVPPTQYALSNTWENTNFKHQVFTDISNLQPPLQDGDKQTVEIDKDTTLSGYEVCTTKDTAKCSTNSNLNHYPISLNNLDIFSTASTIDEPDSRGRNNVAASALMSPHKYATVNVGIANQSSINGLKINRAMNVFSETPNTSLTGRGGLKYMYEMMVMNNMAYYYQGSTTDYIGHNQLLFSYSDAPVDSLFINRVNLCIGPGADPTSIKIYKVPRQWNSGVNYLQPSPYFSGYGITNTASSCPSVVTEISAYQDCQSTGTNLSNNDWGVVNTYASADELNQTFYNGLNANFNQQKSSPGSTIKEGYYYDSTSGMLYFNMIQYPQQTAYTKAVTPPYATCDSANYSSAKEAIVNYLAFSNSNNIDSTLNDACYAESGTPTTSELLTCPEEGCAVYTVEFTAPATTVSCTLPSWHPLSEGNKPSYNQTNYQVTYAPPYILYDSSTSVALAPKSYTLEVLGNNSIQTQRDFNYDQTNLPQMPTGNALLPLTKPVYETNTHSVQLGNAPPPSGPVWTFNTGAAPTAGQQGTITASSGLVFQLNNPPNYTSSTSLSIQPADPPANAQNFYYVNGETAVVSFGGNQCTVQFDQATSTVSVVNPPCHGLTANGTQIQIPAP
ncbi:G8 domain-containing protein [Thiotrichales bacterium 19S3-7]|nr:G8 domain-containing protein [Thiotrichales bacterium 19S3-7]MCF6802942.1 G8 domain-containing protein [Thiotrichales bacterium 19S3-11]